MMRSGLPAPCRRMVERGLYRTLCSWIVLLDRRAARMYTVDLGPDPTRRLATCDRRARRSRRARLRGASTSGRGRVGASAAGMEEPRAARPYPAFRALARRRRRSGAGPRSGSPRAPVAWASPASSLSTRSHNSRPFVARVALARVPAGAKGCTYVAPEFRAPSRPLRRVPARPQLVLSWPSRPLTTISSEPRASRARFLWSRVVRCWFTAAPGHKAWLAAVFRLLQLLAPGARLPRCIQH